MTTTALDALIQKETGETVRGLDALFKGIGPTVSRLPANVPAAKAKPALVKVTPKAQNIGGVPGPAVSSRALLVLLHMI